MFTAAPYELHEGCLLLAQAPNPFPVLSMISFSQWQCKFLPIKAYPSTTFLPTLYYVDCKPYESSWNNANLSLNDKPSNLTKGAFVVVMLW